MVQHKQTRELYALKYINKTKCVKMKAVTNIIQERQLLEEIDHPFVVNLRYAFQDDENCFFVLDLMLGGDLRFHLDRLGCFEERSVRFYLAELSSAVAFLHEKRIMHRDIKPDNILIDDRGHVHLTDFNIAVHYSERKPVTSVAGSMAYMAPEILIKKGYSYMIDWWSLGVCAYELTFGRRPYMGKTNSDLTDSILNDPLVFPENADMKCSRAGIYAIKAFLDRDFSKRLGYRLNGDGSADVQRHPWFASIDWNALDHTLLQPPFVPDSKKANFDASHELEELLLEDNPLRAKHRKQDVSTMSPEMRQMEEQFTTYDFKAMQRRSYYPNNQQIISMTTGTSSIGAGVSRPSTPVTPDGQTRPLPHYYEMKEKENLPQRIDQAVDEYGARRNDGDAIRVY